MQELKAKNVSGDFKPTPTVSVKDKAGSFFEGKLLAHKEVASSYEHPWNVYDFEVKDTDMAIIRTNKSVCRLRSWLIVPPPLPCWFYPCTVPPPVYQNPPPA